MHAEIHTPCLLTGKRWMKNTLKPFCFLMQKYYFRGKERRSAPRFPVRSRPCMTLMMDDRWRMMWTHIKRCCWGALEHCVRPHGSHEPYCTQCMFIITPCPLQQQRLPWATTKAHVLQNVWAKCIRVEGELHVSCRAHVCIRSSGLTLPRWFMWSGWAAILMESHNTTETQG